MKDGDKSGTWKTDLKEKGLDKEIKIDCRESERRTIIYFDVILCCTLWQFYWFNEQRTFDELYFIRVPLIRVHRSILARSSETLVEERDWVIWEVSQIDIDWPQTTNLPSPQYYSLRQITTPSRKKIRSELTAVDFGGLGIVAYFSVQPFPVVNSVFAI